MSIEQLRRAMKERKRVSRRQAKGHAVVAARADARARRLLALLDTGASREEIAAELGVSRNTANAAIGRALARTSNAA